MHQIIQLKNGLRLITVPMQGTKTITVLVVVGTGSKYEDKNNNGISHFLEHMFFKGTEKMPTEFDVTERIDRIGGYLNAFTDKEHVGYYTKIRSEHLDIGLEWMADILLGSKFDPAEIEREKGVVLEEINMYQDTPQDHVWDLWSKVLYGDQPAGRPILGEAENVKSFSRADIISFIGNHYSTRNTIVVLAGDVSPTAISKIEKLFENYKKSGPKEKENVREAQNTPNFLLQEKETEQTHLCLGVRGVDLFSEKRYIQKIISVILGGMMSSRLFISLRSKHGLAYYVATYSNSYTDSGYLVTAAGVDRNRTEKGIGLILDQYRDLAEKRIGEKELERAKERIKGSLSLSLESSSAQASFYGKQELLRNKIETVEEIFSQVDAVTPAQIQDFSKEIFQLEGLNMALIGPCQDEGKFKKIINNF